MLDKGKLVSEGTPKDVVDEYNRLIATQGRAASVKDRGLMEGSTQQATANEIAWGGMFKINPNEDRYGSKKAEILEAGIFTTDDIATQVLERNREFCIKIKVRHNESMPAAIVAYSIKDPKGMILCGTNTLYHNIDMGQAVTGAVVLVVFKQVVRINPGDYFLSVGCGTWEKDEYVVYDRRFDYLPFQVMGKPLRVGLFDPESEVEWKHCN
jgi:teichoic acid transport system ATP-binding protein